MSETDDRNSAAPHSSQVSIGEVEFTAAGFSAMIKGESMRRREWLEQWYGPRCPDYCSSCIVCKIWRNQDQFEKLVNL